MTGDKTLEIGIEIETETENRLRLGTTLQHLLFTDDYAHPTVWERMPAQAALLG